MGIVAPAGAPVSVVRLGESLVLALDFDARGQKLVAGGSEGMLRIWDLTHFDRNIEGNRAYQAALRR